jgi:UDP-N-acetylglucosamine 3-dehydrogenase
MNSSRKQGEDNGLKDRVNIAVIGAGYWGKKVIEEYLHLSKKDEKVDLAFVCDVDPDNLRYCAEELGITKEKLTQDYGEALSSGNIDAVHICTPNDTHYQICKQSLEAGKHALLEKPMALHAKDAWELVSAAEDRGLILQVGHIFRFNNALKATRDLISTNYLGELYYMKLQWTTHAPSPFNRDIIFDLGPHPLDILHYLLNRWPEKVTCKAKAYRRESLEELAYFTMEFDDRLLAHVELSWLEPRKTRELVVIGSERTATVDCLSQRVEIYANCNGGRFKIDVASNNTILDEVGHFAHSIRINKNGRNPGSIGAENVAVLESLRRSLATGGTVRVDFQG